MKDFLKQIPQDSQNEIYKHLDIDDAMSLRRSCSFYYENKVLNDSTSLSAYLKKLINQGNRILELIANQGEYETLYSQFKENVFCICELEKKTNYSKSEDVANLIQTVIKLNGEIAIKTIYTFENNDYLHYLDYDADVAENFLSIRLNDDEPLLCDNVIEDACYFGDFKNDVAANFLSIRLNDDEPLLCDDVIEDACFLRDFDNNGAESCFQFKDDKPSITRP